MVTRASGHQATVAGVDGRPAKGAGQHPDPAETDHQVLALSTRRVGHVRAPSQTASLFMDSTGALRVAPTPPGSRSAPATALATKAEQVGGHGSGASGVVLEYAVEVVANSRSALLEVARQVGRQGGCTGPLPRCVESTTVVRVETFGDSQRNGGDQQLELVRRR